MEKTYQQKKQEVIDFFKDAFCVDGEVQFASLSENKKLNNAPYFWVRLKDSKRGTFFVTTSGQELTSTP